MLVSNLFINKSVFPSSFSGGFFGQKIYVWNRTGLELEEEVVLDSNVHGVKLVSSRNNDSIVLVSKVSGEVQVFKFQQEKEGKRARGRGPPISTPERLNGAYWSLHQEE